jgi:hypothetical protein
LAQVVQTADGLPWYQLASVPAEGNSEAAVCARFGKLLLGFEAESLASQLERANGLQLGWTSKADVLAVLRRMAACDAYLGKDNEKRPIHVGALLLDPQAFAVRAASVSASSSGAIAWKRWPGVLILVQLPEISTRSRGRRDAAWTAPCNGLPGGCSCQNCNARNCL